MYKIEFKNAIVRDDGYGLEVNNKPLSKIISTLLGSYVKTEEGEKRATYSSDRLPEFYSNSCDITIIINPHYATEYLETDEQDYVSVKEMEADRLEQFNKKNKETDTEE